MKEFDKGVLEERCILRLQDSSPEHRTRRWSIIPQFSALGITSLSVKFYFTLFNLDCHPSRTRFAPPVLYCNFLATSESKGSNNSLACHQICKALVTNHSVDSGVLHPKFARRWHSRTGVADPSHPVLAVSIEKQQGILLGVRRILMMFFKLPSHWI